MGCASYIQQDVNSYVRQKLIRTQEEILVEYVNKLNDRGFSLIPQILKNITESITRTTLNPNWIVCFCKRYYIQLISIYLRIIDYKRKFINHF